jgi:hypothetical protein
VNQDHIFRKTFRRQCSHPIDSSVVVSGFTSFPKTLDCQTGASEHYNVLIRCPITGSGLRADVKDQHTSTRGKPLLDERTFQQLLGAAYILQQHYDRLLARELKATYAQTLSSGAIVENLRPPRVLPTPQTRAHPLPPLVPVHRAHPACRNKALGKQVSLTDTLFWKVAMVVAVASVSALLLGAAVHRSSALPDRPALSSEVGHQEARFRKTKRIIMAPTQTGLVGARTVATELPSATNVAAPIVRRVVAGQLPASRVNPASEADTVAEDTVVRYGPRSAAPRSPAQKKP